MADRHGKAFYPGINQIVACTYTASHGISPGCAVVSILPQNVMPAPFGDLIITDGVGVVRLRDMRLDAFKIQTDGSGIIWSLELNDRRWRWRDMGTITGCYNQLDPNGKLVPWTVRSPYELCLLCLRAMGETRFVIDMPPGLTSAVGQGISDYLVAGSNLPPTGVNPPVQWDGENPAQALQRIAELFGRRVILDPITNTVLVVRQGLGRRLPGGSIYSDSPSARFPQVPDAIQVVGEPTRYQVRLELEPVGREYDGSYRAIDQLTYAPVVGGALHEWTYTVVTSGDPATWRCRFPDQNNEEFFYDDTLGAATEADIVDELADQINSSAAVSHLVTASNVSDVLVVKAKRQGFTFAFLGYVQPATEIVPGGTNPEAFVALVRTGRLGRKTWDFCPPPLFPTVTPTEQLSYAQAQTLAQQSVWKCYRLTGADVASGPRLGRRRRTARPVNVPGYGPITRRQQLLLLSTKVDQILPLPVDLGLKDSLGRPVILHYYDGYSKEQPAQVYGSIARTIIAPSFFLNRFDGVNTLDNEPVYVNFSIDPVYQVVTFGDYVYKVEAGRPFAPPRLILETAVHVRDPQTNALVRYTPQLNLKANPKVIASCRRQDVQLNVTATYSPTGAITGTRLLEADAVLRANYYLQGMAAQYFLQDAQQRAYNGILPIGLDGAIAQVTWTIDGNGQTTKASRNCEHDLYVPPYPARRRIEAIRPGEVEKIRQGAVPDRVLLSQTPTGQKG